MNPLPARTLAALAALIAVLGACGPASSPATLTQGQSVEAVYTLGSGDRVKITTFRHEDLSGEFALDGNGNFALPLVGEVEAYGLTTRELEDRIETMLSDGYLVEPQVSVEVINYRPFYILGEVNNPGQYPYVNGLTVLNAVALAGGFTYRARENGVIVKRGGDNAEGVVVAGTTPILPGDLIQVPERFF